MLELIDAYERGEISRDVFESRIAAHYDAEVDGIIASHAGPAVLAAHRNREIYRWREAGYTLQHAARLIDAGVTYARWFRRVMSAAGFSRSDAAWLMAK